MPVFEVKCKTASGETVSDRKNSESRNKLATDLRAQGLTPVSISKVEEGSQESEGDEAEGGWSIPFLGPSVKLDEVALAFRTLATMLGGGLPIMQCLREVAAQSDNDYLADAFRSVAQQVSEGTNLAEALEKYPAAFSDLTCSMVRAGQESGTLEKVLSQLAEYYESRLEMKRKIKAGTRYPMFIILFFAGALSVIFFYIIPKFKSIFSRVGADLPFVTRVLMNISTTVASNIVYVVPTVLGIAIGFYIWKQSEHGIHTIDRLKLKMPVLGEVVHQIAIGRLSSSLALLIQSGMPILEALELSETAAGNRIIQEDLQETKQKLLEGEQLSDQLAKREVFPRLLVSMTAAGESSGQLGDMLERVAEHYERESAASIEGLLSLIEPAILVAMGVVVGIVVYAIYIPIFQMAQTAG